MISINPKNKKKKIELFELPGKRVSGTITVAYLSAILIIPLIFLGMALFQTTWSELVSTLQSPRLLSALGLTIGTAFIAALINLIFGIVIAWTQVKYRYPGKEFVTMLIDLPFALPTAVTGIALTAAFSSQSVLGGLLSHWGITINYTPLGIILAMIFIGIPFVIRQVEPVLEELGTEMEQAAQLLGANSIQIFWRIILPNITAAAITGFTAAFARGLGEYGSVIFISGNMPFKTEVVSLLIVTKLEQFDYSGAVIISALMLILSLGFLLLSNGLQYIQRKKFGMVKGNQP